MGVWCAEAEQSGRSCRESTGGKRWKRRCKRIAVCKMQEMRACAILIVNSSRFDVYWIIW
ncbi:MAG: hypothetical protein K0R57_1951 [Paenibacillaceae bacterium]|jgi:hypothetical protein|nr:hypothetical protein [Paenibacillaceae bacterium]